MNNVNIDESISKLEKDGFVNIQSFFNVEQIKIISGEVKLIYKKELNIKKKNDNEDDNEGEYKLRKYHNTAYKNDRGVISASLLGKSPVIDDFMKNLFHDADFNDICKKIVGDNYRVYTLSARTITPEGTELSPHQDNYGVLTISIPLNDISSNMGTTLFLPGSHKYSLDVLNKLFCIPLKCFKFLCEPHIAKLGDLGLFFTKTYHAASKGEVDSTIIIIALVGEDGFSYKPWSLPSKTTYGESFESAIGIDLFKRLSSLEDVYNYNELSFTKSSGIGSKTYNRDQSPVIIGKGFDNRKMHVLPCALNKNSNLIINHIISDNSCSFKSLLVCGYLRIWITIALFKNLAHAIKIKLKKSQ
jgi:putative 2OG-Fe(II) oxygenase